MATVWFVFCSVKVVANNILEKQLYNDRKYVCKESCFQDSLVKYFNSMGYNGFLKNVSMRLLDKTGWNKPKKGTLLEENFKNVLTFWT